MGGVFHVKIPNIYDKHRKIFTLITNMAYFEVKIYILMHSF